MKTILLIDSGYLKHVFKESGYLYSSDGVEAFALSFFETVKNIDKEDNLFRILFYDCLPYQGTVSLPISKSNFKFEANDSIMRQLEVRSLFACRYGTLKFRGYVLKKGAYSKKDLDDSDFEPLFEQKGVDMRIGLDISQYANEKSVDHIILISNDTDCIPAMKYARKKGLKMSMVDIGKFKITRELKTHCDQIYSVSFPNSSRIKKFKSR